MFEHLNNTQIEAVAQMACLDFHNTLLTGPNLGGILNLMSQAASTYPAVTLTISNLEEDMWANVLAFYKHPKNDISRCSVRIYTPDQPAIDTGGVRHQVYCAMIKQFIENKHAHLFDATMNNLHPHFSAAASCSSLFEVLGSIVGHSIVQDGIGFPHFNEVCYWYIVSGADTALRYTTKEDVGADCRSLICKVSYISKTTNLTKVINIISCFIKII